MIDLLDYGFTPDRMPPEAAGIPARVTAVYKERYALVCECGECFGRLKAGTYFGGGELFPTVGDFVLIAYHPQGDSSILRTLERRTFFSRRDPTPGRGEQAVAANFDTVFLVQSLNENFNVKRLERYLTLAWQSGAEPVVVLTKADLPGDHGPEVRAAELAACGAAVLPVSARTGAGLTALEPYLKPRETVVFLGSSGVGKSSLANALAGKEVMAVSEIREEDGRGRHTTTHRQLLRLPSGVMVIDTPGMRELGMWDITGGLGGAFADVEQYFGHCRFSDCRHQQEPGCAVKAAIGRGELSQERWENYQKLKHEAKYSDDKGAFLRQRQERHKETARWSRQRKRAGNKKQ